MELEQKIQYNFKDKSFLENALTHSSYANEKKNTCVKSNERMEFLGDAVLELLVSHYIFIKHTNLTEGEMTKLRASIVCEQSLAKAARNINLGDSLRLGKGELISKGNERDSILADAFEALLGAVYLDGGIQNAKKHLEKTLFLYWEKDRMPLYVDYKTQLQEILQKNKECKIEYMIISENGPDHNKEFVVEIKYNNNVIGHGTGKNKKEAEQNAAFEAIKKYN